METKQDLNMCKSIIDKKDWINYDIFIEIANRLTNKMKEGGVENKGLGVRTPKSYTMNGLFFLSDS